MVRVIGKQLGTDEAAEYQGSNVAGCFLVTYGEVVNRLVYKKGKRSRSENCAGQTRMPPELDCHPDHDHQKHQRQN